VTTQYFGFECSCSRCGRGEAWDAVLAKILALGEELGQPDTTKPGEFNKIKQLVGWYQEDGLQALLDGPYGRFALAYAAAGDIEEAKKYAQLAADVLGANSGINEENSALGKWKAIAKYSAEYVVSNSEEGGM
jgi:hypothetical protein